MPTKQISLKMATYAQVKEVCIRLGIPVVGYPITELRGRIKSAQNGLALIDVECAEGEVPPPRATTPEEIKHQEKVVYQDNEGVTPDFIGMVPDDNAETETAPSQDTNTNTMSETEKAVETKKKKAPAKKQTVKKAKAEKPAKKEKAEKKAAPAEKKEWPKYVQEIVGNKETTMADKIRALDKKGMSTGDIASACGLIYQRVRNILKPWQPKA